MSTPASAVTSTGGASLLTESTATSTKSSSTTINDNDTSLKSKTASSGANNLNENSQDKGKLRDDEICDDWEQLDQQKIEKSLQSIKINSKNNQVNSDRIFNDTEEEKTFKNSNSSSNIQPFINANQYPPQSIKILKRPASNKKLNELSNQSQNSNGPSQPIKTFEQREQEYAQARLRILGSAHPEEDMTSNSQIVNNQNSNNSAQLQPHITNTISYPNFSINNNNNNNNVNYNTNSSHSSMNVNINTNYNNNNSYSQPSKLNLLRDPIAPDPSSKGFRNVNNTAYAYATTAAATANNNYNNSNNFNKNFNNK